VNNQHKLYLDRKQNESIINQGERAEPLTHATTDLGNWLNGKLVLYLGIFGKSEE
jgi:hypothetical protein